MKISNLKRIGLEDIKDLFVLAILIPIGTLLRLVYRDIWLISERRDEARDNGYWFFKYVHENNLHNKTFYIIDKDSKDYEKLKAIAPNRIIKFGKFKHYLYYILGNVHISAHIGGGMINPKIIRHLEKRKLIVNKKIFLQHGIIKDTLEWTFRNTAFIDIFCCSATREWEFVKENFGYEDHQLVITGQCRFDNIFKYETRKQILLMPTWRHYLKYDDEESVEIFKNSDYYKTFTNFLNNSELDGFLEKNGYNLIFYPHSEMQAYLNCFNIKSDRIIMADKNKYDIQRLLKESSILITDYSSVFFDFAYMKKMCIYYQFDYKKFREGHWKEGYFSYENDAFGPLVDNEQDLFENLKRYIQNGCILESEYINKIDGFFKYNDQNNCKRVYEQVMSLK